MDASHKYRWTARADPLGGLWPLTPALLEDEVISSWLVRCALAHDCEPIRLTGNVWPDVRVWIIDVDRELNRTQLTALHLLSGMAVETLEASTLAPLWRQMTGVEHFPYGVAPWILCLGVRNRRRCGGLQYCPLCFEAREPHYLIQGRLAWHTVCSVHQVGLLDRCERCDAPLCPHLIVPPARDLGRCHRCNYELRCATPAPFLEGAGRFQNATDGLFSGPPLLYGQHQQPLAEWLSLTKWMMGVLRAGLRGHGSRTDLFFKRLGVCFDGVTPPATGLPFEYLTPIERANLLSNVWRLIEVGPDQLISAARDERVRPSLLVSQTKQLPEALSDLVSVLHGHGAHHAAQNHAEKPRSPKNVLMRWRRLLRKFQR